MKPYMWDGPFNKERLISELNALEDIRERANTMMLIEMGLRLLRLKAELEHAEWMEIYKNRLRMRKQQVWEAMKCATQFADKPLLSQLGDSKLKEMIALSPEEVELLEQNEHPLTTLDELKGMTVLEIREMFQKRGEANKNLRTHNVNLKKRNEFLEAQLKDKDRIDAAVKSDVFGMYLRTLDAMGDLTKALANASEEDREAWVKKLFMGLLGAWNQIAAQCGAEIRPHYTFAMTDRNFRPPTTDERIQDEIDKEFPQP